MVCTIDIYDVLKAFDVDPVLVNPIKKLLASGLRGHKDRSTDIKEAYRALERAISIEAGLEYYGI